MSRDDLIYAILLLLGIAFGHYYKRIGEVAVKKSIGTFFGVAIILFTSGAQSLHLLFNFLVCYGIMKFIKSKSHLCCFWFMMIYLFFFRTVHWYGLSTPGGHTNMIQMILTLKLIGFAFERDAAMTKARSADKDDDDKNVLTAAEKEIKDVSIFSMFHYCFNYIGLLTGPYFTFKTFYDYFHYPFAVHSDSWKATLDKLKWVPLYIALGLGCSYIWPIEYATSEEFYVSRSWLYRLFYVWPSFFIFRMRIYSGIILSECICTAAGFGAYPKELESRCGHGPSKAITQEYIEKPENREYDFETIENINVPGVESCVSFREAMKHWNRCVQYWLAMYVYKRFPSKTYRVMAIMAVSAYWHGVHAGHYFCILGPIVYLPVEDIYTKLVKAYEWSEVQHKIINAIMWILKFFAFSYLGTAFLLKDVGKIWFYYGSVYHFAYVFWAALYVGSMFLLKQKKIAMKRETKGTVISSSNELKIE